MVIVLLIAQFTFNWSRSLDDTGQQTTGEIRHEPDYFLTNFEATVYEDDGKLSYIIKGSHLNHFPDDNTMSLEQPRLHYLYEEEKKWLAQSKQGTIFANKSKITLTGQVVITNTHIQGKNSLTIQTSELHIFIDEKYASTTKEVTILGDSSTINAKGMKIDFDTGELFLLSESKGTYEP